MKQKDLIDNFIHGDTYGNSSNLYIVSDKLINYTTVIAVRTPEGIVLNSTRYSNSTSKIQNILRESGHIVKELPESQFQEILIYKEMGINDED